MSVVVAPLSTEDSSSVRQLLIDGLSERWGTYEPRFNPDLEAFPQSFSGSVILVAKTGGAVVGTGTIRPIGPCAFEIVRMSTAASSRRTGVASTILKHLLEHASAVGAHEVVVETTSSWASAVAFYVKHGFAITHDEGGDTHFILRLR
ncbi:MAG: GNAT family N-acetyltransferase [Burkholderiales bacterium]|nr:GNAT family N-acetyltransferase [Burkholderiales bacterium]